MLAVHAQLAAFFDAKRQASVLPYVSSNRAREIRLEGPGGVERPTLRVIHGGREAVRGGGSHPRATELTTSVANSTTAGKHRSVLSPRPAGPNLAVAVTLEAPGGRP